MLKLNRSSPIRVCRGYSVRRNSSTSPQQPAALLPRPPRSESLAGSVQYHTMYLLLHSREAPEAWPPTFTSPLYTSIQRTLEERNGLVNFCWLGSPPQLSCSEGTGEAYSATLWRKMHTHELPRRLDIPIISSSNAELVVRQSISQLLDSYSASEIVDDMHAGPYFYICCHGQRDCRCGVRGGELAAELTALLRERGILFDHNGKPRVGRIGHVGGHKNAPNLLIFPHGDWYGNLESGDLPRLIDHYSASLKETPASFSLLNGPNRFQWRGRMGMTKDEQMRAFHTHEWGATDTFGYSGLL
ncbi:Sucrase/ferredoxin-like-domain-containing protein [Hysterangium stoloniferum]|nr:Sucrase/ferredoxin-like-domain-containing protein [Hysterangium stoloniferum]